MTKNKSLVDAISGEFRTADVPEKDIVILEYAEKLTVDPCNVKKPDLSPLRKNGFKDADILNIVLVVAYYGYVNRIACGLGVELEDYWEEGGL